MAVIAVAPMAAAASVELLEPAPDRSQLVSCPLWHTTHPSLARDALEAAGDWRRTRWDQHWDTQRLETVAAYAAWFAAQDARARVRGATGSVHAAPLSAIETGAIDDAAGRPPDPQPEAAW